MAKYDFQGYSMDVTFMLLNESKQDRDEILSNPTNQRRYARKCIKKLMKRGIPPANEFHIINQQPEEASDAQ